MENKISTYKDLIVWQKSIALVTTVYTISKGFPLEEKFGVVSQLNRAVVSIPTNIAEGWGRESTKNYLQFLRTSRASLFETETLLLISKNLNFISEEDFNKINKELDEISRMLNGLIKSIKQKINLTVA